jgi:site-specific recombinase XerD
MAAKFKLGRLVGTPGALAALERNGAPALPTTHDTNPAAVYLARLRETGRRSMAQRLDTIAQMLGCDGWQATPWERLEYAHVEALKSKLAEDYAPASVNATLSAVRGVLRCAWKMRLIDAETYHRIASVEGVTGSREPAGRALTQGELGAMMRACEDTPAGVRDGAIIAVSYAGGLRRAELAALDLEDLRDDDGQIIALRVLGKRNKERTVYIDNGGADALRDWLSVRGDAPGPFFWAGRRGGHLARGQRLSAQSIYAIIQRRAEQAGVKVTTPHDLRRSFVSDLLDSGVDISTVAKMAGHSSVNTTQRYDRRPEQAKRKAAGSLHVAYQRRRLEG